MVETLVYVLAWIGGTLLLVAMVAVALVVLIGAIITINGGV